jgi:translation elongation factor EF-Tu-like GTPase
MTFEVAYNFQAKITLFATQSGGRKKSIFSGYKPSFVFNSQKQ